jgi:hypothetical protein
VCGVVSMQDPGCVTFFFFGLSTVLEGHFPWIAREVRYISDVSPSKLITSVTILIHIQDVTCTNLRRWTEYPKMFRCHPKHFEANWSNVLKFTVIDGRPGDDPWGIWACLVQCWGGDVSSLFLYYRQYLKHQAFEYRVVSQCTVRIFWGWVVAMRHLPRNPAHAHVWHSSQGSSHLRWIIRSYSMHFRIYLSLPFDVI